MQFTLGIFLIYKWYILKLNKGFMFYPLVCISNMTKTLLHIPTYYLEMKTNRLSVESNKLMAMAQHLSAWVYVTERPLFLIVCVGIPH
ncbi:hypothetical protein XELAEV_18007957mg [Xenopus laevis]|uniref:Uncharacterized protein n=1 Tax=Xenopus laevis TaxID=8355 RepID=A0A974E2N9_XENLA|nr:hypothetical protein XELAEV_18007957mg [Xenopus laevis]